MSDLNNHGASGLNGVQEQKLKRSLRRNAPSEPWVEAQIATAFTVDFSGRRQAFRRYDPNVFPPGGKHTAMICCPSCGVFTPPHALEQDVCLDHSPHLGWGRSPSAAAIERIQHYNVKMHECDLEPESHEALTAEIRQHRHS